MRIPGRTLPALLLLSASSCSVRMVAQDESAMVANTCQSSAECGSGAYCESGACVASSTTIDEVLFEVIPDSQSEFGGLSFVSTLEGVRAADRNRAIHLPGATQAFVPGVLADLSDFSSHVSGSDCPSSDGQKGAVQLPAHIEYTRKSSVGGVPILGLPKLSVVVDVNPATMSINVNQQPASGVSLLPGTYDIYVEPGRDPIFSKCEVGPFVQRNVVVPEAASSAAQHSTIVLPKPVVLDGTVLRKGGSLVGWTVDVVEPVEGKVISTVGPIGSTSMDFVTNFRTITYQTPSGPADFAAGNPLVRLTPPPDMVNSAPTVYWDISAVDINGIDAQGHETISVDMTGVPTPEKLVAVHGRVTGKDAPDVGVRSSLGFFSTSLDGAPGITAVFNPTAVTDALGNYKTKLFPGQYRVVATPIASTEDQGARDNNGGVTTPSGSSVTTPWAITEVSKVTIGGTDDSVDFALTGKVIISGSALAGARDTPALGATFQAVPSILLDKVGVLRGALAQTAALPPSASVPIDDKGAFSLPVDPGAFDLSLRPADASNFAWWVLPAKRIDETAASPVLRPRLSLPVPIQGEITVGPGDDAGKSVPLRRASVRAYAKVPSGGSVTKVGETRTDDNGLYRLGLPESFGE